MSRAEVSDAAAELDELGFPALRTPSLDGHGALDDFWDHLLTAAPRATMALGALDLEPGPGRAGRALGTLDASADHVALHVLNNDLDEGSGTGTSILLHQWHGIVTLVSSAVCAERHSYPRH